MPIEQISPPSGLSFIGRNSARSMSNPTAPTATTATATPRKNGSSFWWKTQNSA